MSQHASAEPTTNGRDADGRFAKGNHLGTGNPFARQVAALRSALIEAVSPQDIKEIACILLLNAKAGDLASIKLLFQYVLGKPQSAVNPDTLDREELKLLHEQALAPEALDALSDTVPVGAVLPLQRIQAEAQEMRIGKALGEELQKWDEEQARGEEPVTAAAEKPRPSNNGGNGRTARATRPSTNGAHEEISAASRGQAPSPNGARGTALDAFTRFLCDLRRPQKPS